MISSDFDAFLTRLDEQHLTSAAKVPPVQQAQAWIEALLDFLFPIRTERPLPARVVYPTLHHQLTELVSRVQPDNRHRSEKAVADRFFAHLPRVHRMLLADSQAFFDFDPAAESVEEVIATYCSFSAIAIYRLAHVLHTLQVPLLPRLFSEYAHSKTGIDIHPGASIGEEFFIDHGTGVVIGATATIGRRVKIYQGVTLGATQVDKSLSTTKRHPTIEDDVVIYANASILGGNTVIGHSSVIGGNTWLTKSVPPYSVVLHEPQIKLRTKPFEEPVSFVI